MSSRLLLALVPVLIVSATAAIGVDCAARQRREAETREQFRNRYEMLRNTFVSPEAGEQTLMIVRRLKASAPEEEWRYWSELYDALERECQRRFPPEPFIGPHDTRQPF